MSFSRSTAYCKQFGLELRVTVHGFLVKILTVGCQLKKTTTATAMATFLSKRFNEKNNSCARAL